MHKHHLVIEIMFVSNMHSRLNCGVAALVIIFKICIFKAPFI